jgi:hypothetical protein
MPDWYIDEYVTTEGETLWGVFSPGGYLIEGDCLDMNEAALLLLGLQCARYERD